MSTATTAALRGTLQDFGAEEILQFLAGTKQSGALVLSGDSHSILWFVDGEVYGADATTSLPLKDAFEAAGLADEAQLSAAWVESAGGVPLAEALERHAGIDPAETDRLVLSRIVDAVFELTVTSAADFEFRGGERHPLAGGRTALRREPDRIKPREARTLARGGDGAAFDRGGRHPRRCRAVRRAGPRPLASRVARRRSPRRSSFDRRHHASARRECVRRVRHVAPARDRGRSFCRLNLRRRPPLRFGRLRSLRSTIAASRHPAAHCAAATTPRASTESATPSSGLSEPSPREPSASSPARSVRSEAPSSARLSSRPAPSSKSWSSWCPGRCRHS